MSRNDDYRIVLDAYDASCQPYYVEPLANNGGFSGAYLWRLSTSQGRLCLRRWPKQHPNQQRLEFIHAVLRHVDQEGLRLTPRPIRTNGGKTFCRQEDHLWELTPWMPGEANYHQAPTTRKLQAAVMAVARFHNAASSYRSSMVEFGTSPGLVQRRAHLQRLTDQGQHEIARNVSPGNWPELAERARHLLELFPIAASRVAENLAEAAELQIRRQICLRDIWHDHVLFTGEEVRGLIDFGAMQFDSIGGDIARLLGSMAQNDEQNWQVGMDAYQSVRPMSPEEIRLVKAFDHSSVLMSGMNWLMWIYVDHKSFDGHAQIIARIDNILERLEYLVASERL